MNSVSPKKKSIIYIVLAVLILIFLTALFIITRWNDYLPVPASSAEIARLQTEEYQAVFLSMYPLTAYSEEDFLTYRGLRTIIIGQCFEYPQDLSSFLKDFTAADTISNFYLGLDPGKIGEACFFMQENYGKIMDEYLLSFIDAHPSITFEILLPYHSIDYWCELTTEKRSSILDAYRLMIPSLLERANVKVFYLGSEEWLISNPANYDSEVYCQPDISKNLFLLTFCDRDYQVTMENFHISLDRLEQLIAVKQNAPPIPDLSDFSIVFLGDSIIGNYNGSLSVPGVVNGLSNATVYNLAEGGTSAAFSEDNHMSFTVMADALASGDLSKIGEDKRAYPCIQDFFQSGHDNLIFMINYGLNDYFTGFPIASDDPYDITTYMGALRYGTQRIRESYPEAAIILMTPNYITRYANGTEIPAKGGGILTDYVNAVISLSEEMSVGCLNVYEKMGLQKENPEQYTTDGCHLNNSGRYQLGLVIIEKLNTIRND